MKGTKPLEKDMNILCLSFPNKWNQTSAKATLKTGGDFELEITKTTKKNFFWPIEIKN